MYQMAHSELLVRIQQRDQYYICIIGAFIAVVVGVFGTKSIQESRILVISCVIGFGLMLFLTLLLWGSCSIYDELIEHIKALEMKIAGNSDGNLIDNIQMWQCRIDTTKKNHRIYSFLRAKTVFIILDIVAGIFILYTFCFCKCGCLLFA